MPNKRDYTILRGDVAKSLKSLDFERFDIKPVNYHKDILAEIHTPKGKVHEPQVPVNEVRETLERETERQRQSFEQMLKEKVSEARAKARAEAESEVQKSLDLLKSYSALLQSEKEELSTRYEQEVLDLAFDLAEKILGEHLTERPEAVAQITKHALQQVIDCNKITVRANPGDLDYLQNLRVDLAGQLSQETRLEFISDKSIAPGGCVIDTEKGTLDARIPSQLETMKNNIKSSSGE